MTSLETFTIAQSSRTCKHKKSEVNLIAHQSALSWVDNYIAFQPKEKEIQLNKLRLIQHLVTVFNENSQNSDGQMTRTPCQAKTWSQSQFH